MFPTIMVRSPWMCSVTNEAGQNYAGPVFVQTTGAGRLAAVFD